MNTRFIIFALLVAMIAAALPSFDAKAYDGPSYRTASTNDTSIKALYIEVEQVRKVQHSNTSTPVDMYAGWTYIVFEDGSWLLDQDGLPNTQDGIYVTWDMTGCIAGGTCQ